jgi:signal transduction histidine kinase
LTLGGLDVRVLAVVGLALAVCGDVRMRDEVLEHGSPDGLVLLRMAVVVVLLLGGLGLQLVPARRRLGLLLLAAASVPGLSLLAESDHSVAFTIGTVTLALTPVALAWLMLSAPTGRINSRLERNFIAVNACVMLVLGSAIAAWPHAHTLNWVGRVVVVLLSCGTAGLMIGRESRANPHGRRLLGPMVVLAVLYAAIALTFFAFHLAGSHETARYVLVIGNVCTALAIPIAVLLGLAIERAALGRTLASFVSNLGTEAPGDVQAAMARTLHDPELRIFYRRGETSGFLDAEGRHLPDPAPARLRTMIEGAHSAAVVDYADELAGQEDFLGAAATTALLSIEKARLTADLSAARSSLEASRLRLSTAADEERQRIQRDLHDGAQQHLIAMHLKLESALESLEDEPAHSAALMTEIGAELGETAHDLRSLASAVFPPTLREFGLVTALASAIRTMGLSVHLESASVGRQPLEVETQVYFVCLEGLQNIAKHCGQDVPATLKIWGVHRSLYFELRDTGPGFEPLAGGEGLGLENMHDRLASIGGWTLIASEPGRGTLVRGMAPTRAADSAMRSHGDRA